MNVLNTSTVSFSPSASFFVKCQFSSNLNDLSSVGTYMIEIEINDKIIVSGAFVDP